MKTFEIQATQLRTLDFGSIICQCSVVNPLVKRIMITQPFNKTFIFLLLYYFFLSQIGPASSFEVLVRKTIIVYPLHYNKLFYITLELSIEF